MNETPKPPRALICEDEGMTVLMLRRALQSAGYEVAGEAPNGEKGVELALSLKPDLIIMDINMPGLDGIAATRRILAELSVPIVMLTAYSEDNKVNAAIEAGASAYLVKPIERRQLIPALKTALARFEALQEVREENKDLKDTLETRKMVERAKGILMERSNLSEAEAFRRLQKISRDKCQKMKETAQQIIEADSVFTEKKN